MTESFKSCNKAYEFNFSFSFDDERIDAFQKTLGYNIPYDSKTFTEDFNEGFKNTCQNYATSAQVHSTFENHISGALNSFDGSYEFWRGRGQRFTFNILFGRAISSKYAVNDGTTTGSGEVVYGLTFSVSNDREQVDSGEFEFTVRCF
jgi:hypothetical protein